MKILHKKISIELPSLAEIASCVGITIWRLKAKRQQKRRAEILEIIRQEFGIDKDGVVQQTTFGDTDV